MVSPTATSTGCTSPSAPAPRTRTPHWIRAWADPVQGSHPAVRGLGPRRGQLGWIVRREVGPAHRHPGRAELRDRQVLALHGQRQRRGTRSRSSRSHSLSRPRRRRPRRPRRRRPRPAPPSRSRSARRRWLPAVPRWCLLRVSSAGEQVNLTLFSDPITLSPVTADQTGVARVEFIVPSGLPGRHPPTGGDRPELRHRRGGHLRGDRTGGVVEPDAVPLALTVTDPVEHARPPAAPATSSAPASSSAVTSSSAVRPDRW